MSRRIPKMGMQILARTDLTAAQVKTPKLAIGQKYVWRVRACRDVDCSAWWKFTRE